MSSDGVPPVVPFAIGLAGIGLILAALRNVGPIQQLRAVLSGGGSAGPIDSGAGLDAGPAGTPAADTGNYASTLTATPVLVSIGQGGHRLRGDAAAAFAVWQSRFGAPITLTDSYRSAAQQAAAYAKDPKRFAPANKSEHVKGTAVDVNLGAVGAKPPVGGKGGNSTWDKLYATATAAGWKNPRGPYNGDHAEPWHFSRNGG